MLEKQYANMPAALLTSMKRDKKPFTYTPGGVNLSEVLNHRLQKRMERKKKYSEERSHSNNSMDGLPRFDAPRQLVVSPTYNTPLDMYSMANAMEALEVQAGLVASDKDSFNRSATLPRNHKFDDMSFDEGRGVAQSKAFKVLQIITDTDEETSGRGRGSHQLQEEMRFTGIRDSKAIPSRFFQTLQKITGTDEEDENLPDTRDRTQAPRPAVHQNQQQQPRQGFAPQQMQSQSNFQNNAVTQFQPMNTQRVVSNPDSSMSSQSFLKRPAAFLPMKTGSDSLNRIKPVHPQFLANGPRNTFGPAGGTDF
ncbi:hypothetical protein JTE90_014305 [Oedothorax gibbosus]|uniref:PDZ and LIM domain-containing protein n=1 Tax=Oedothorax gibbosus TaxID=931172 RepID=A0AAV6UX77_9ARAC|nr:hypothetical protein JTE90_014305 [Oedothorax gibbosus]